MPDNNRRTTTDGGISIPPMPNNNTRVEPITKPEIEHIEPIEIPVLENVEPTASFAVDIQLNTKVYPLMATNYIIHVRPQNNWKGKNFGFDWIRKGDSDLDYDKAGIDDHYAKIMGKYFETGANNVCDDANDWLNMKNAPARVCDFRLDVNLYKSLVRNYFPIGFTVPWKVRQPSICPASLATDIKTAIDRSQFIYSPPILLIKNNAVANLTIYPDFPSNYTPPNRVELREPTGEANFSFTNNEYSPAPTGKKNLTVTCNRTFNTFKEINAYAIYNDPTAPNSIREVLCGKIRVHPNNILRTLNVVYIKVKVNIGNGNLIGGNISSNELQVINKLYGQQAIVNIASEEYFLDIPNSIPNPAMPGDPAMNIDVITRHTTLNPAGNRVFARTGLDIFLLAFEQHLATVASTATPGTPKANVHRYDNYIKVFITKEDSINANGSTKYGRRAIALFNSRKEETFAHEMGHALGLPHTFTASDIADSNDPMDASRNAEYTYQARETENIMDYSQLNATRTVETMGNRYALFYWQIKKIWADIDRLNNSTNAIPSETPNEQTVGNDRTLIPYMSAARI